MHVIGKSVWRQAVAADGTLAGPIGEWHKIATSSRWQSLVVGQVYPHAESVDPYTIFEIKGKAYRLIVKIEDRRQIIFVKHLLTHSEYDQGEWKP